ncbi:MAG: hypothetical protein JNJ61_07950 [Anaerolineae bacterium]|nr:hypothetical protein [Anaerolineae bacterium]
MLLDDVFKLIDQLTPDQKRQVRQYIDDQQALLLADIREILASAQPIPLYAGTMDMNKLRYATQSMWAGLDETEIEAIVQSMNEEFLESDKVSDE